MILAKLRLFVSGLIFSSLFVSFAFGHSHENEKEEKGEASASVGLEKAITQANKKQGFQLSKSAIQTLGLLYQEIRSQENYRIPKPSLVHFQEEKGIYRLRGGWFKLIEVQLLSQTLTEVIIKTGELKEGDQLVIHGVPLLRVAELEAWGGSGDGHGH